MASITGPKVEYNKIQISCSNPQKENSIVRQKSLWVFCHSHRGCFTSSSKKFSLNQWESLLQFPFMWTSCVQCQEVFLQEYFPFVLAFKFATVGSLLISSEKVIVSPNRLIKTVDPMNFAYYTLWILWTWTFSMNSKHGLSVRLSNQTCFGVWLEIILGSDLK